VVNFALTVASLSYGGNSRRLQELFDKQERKASRLGVPFSVAKTEVLHWRTAQAEALGEVCHTYSD